MGRSKWFHSKKFIIVLLSALGAAFMAAANEVVSRLGNGKKGGSNSGSE